MSLILSGTDGLSDIDGSAATPAIRGTDANTGIFFPAADTIAFAEGGAEAMRIDSSGNVGIGTSSPTGKLHVSAPASTQYGTFDAVTDTSAFTSYKVGGTTYGFIGDASGLVSGGTAGNLAVRFTGAMLFSGGANERMRIDSSGNLLVGQTTAAVETGSIVTAKNLEITRTIDSDGGALGQLSWVNNTNAGVASGTSFAKDVACIKGLMDGTGNNSGGYLTFETKADAGTRAERMRINSSGDLLVGQTSGNAGARVSIDAGSTDGSPCIDFRKGSATTTTSQVYARFFCNGGAVATGSITANGVAAATFTAYSDRRLKENIIDLPSQLANIMALRPVEFDYIESMGGGHQFGFIAQEVQEVYPDVVGEGADGMLTLADMNKNDARLIKAIQEMKTIMDAQATTITALTARITALEAQNADNPPQG